MQPIAKLQIDDSSFKAAETQLTRLDFAVRTSVLDKALKAAASPVAIAARQYAPDSQRTGSRRLWSKKVRQARSGTAPHKDTIGVSTIRSYGAITAIYVGALYPAGNLINAIGHPHQQVLWGRRTGTTLPATDYLEKAGNATQGAVQSAFVNSVTSQVDRILAKA